jgi:hypothetical protein
MFRSIEQPDTVDLLGEYPFFRLIVVCLSFLGLIVATVQTSYALLVSRLLMLLMLDIVLTFALRISPLAYDHVLMRQS